MLILGAFPGRHHGIGLFRFWPEAIAVLGTFPTVAAVRTAFDAAGFSYVALEPVRQLTAPSLAAIAATARRESHTPLMLISDSAYEAGLARLRAAAAAAAATERAPSSTPSTCSSYGRPAKRANGSGRGTSLAAR